jgi:hypothetical protein
VKVPNPNDDIDALRDDTHASGRPLALSFSEIVNPVVRKNLESLLDWVLDQIGAPGASIVGAGKQ